MPTGNTAQLPRYDITEEETLIQFTEWLQTIDGKSKRKTTAEQEARSTSKFLHWGKKPGTPIDWDVITDRRN